MCVSVFLRCDDACIINLKSISTICGPTANGTKFMIQTLMSNADNKAVQLRAVLDSIVTKVEVPKCRSSPSIRQIETDFQL